MTFIAKIPITATPRTMSSVAIRGCGSVVAVIAAPRHRAEIIERRAPRNRDGRVFLRRIRLELDVILQPHPFNPLELGFQLVDTLLLIPEYLDGAVTVQKIP